MKRLFLIVITFLGLGTLFYGLGIGPFKEELAKGQQKAGKRQRERTVAVQVAKVKIGEVEERLRYVGSLVANVSVTVAPKIVGRIERVFVDVGDRVERGQHLARLEMEELEEEVKEAEASFKVVEATLKGKEAELWDLKRKLERYRILFEKNFIAREEVDTIETRGLSAKAQVELTKAQMAQMKARLDNSRIRLKYAEVISPFAGYVGKRFIERGAIVNSNTPLVTIVDISRVKVIVSVVEKDYRKISPGQLSSITVDAYPGRTFTGKVARVSPVLDKDTRTADFESEISNPGNVLRPGMFARVTVITQKREKAFLIPEAALLRKGEGVGVFKLDRDRKRAIYVPLEIGVTYDGKVEVVRGLEGGDQVITLGSHLLKNGQRVRVVESLS